MSERFKFDRMELAGSLGDLDTLLPIAIAMVLFNGLNPLGLFLSIGLFYVVSGIYFGITVPVQPMKVIGAYAVATSMSTPRHCGPMANKNMIAVAVSISGQKYKTYSVQSTRKQNS